MLALGFSACVRETEPPAEPPAKVLPPDPGPAGKATVPGIDSDEDGLRDDVQILIDTTWSDSATRAACARLTKALQDFLNSGTDEPGALAAAASLNKAIDCLYSVDPEGFGSLVDHVEGAVVNTESRTRAYAKAGALISGGSFPVSTVADNAATCREAP
ncbi:MAG: hypothetical protein K0Q91_1148 [Fibrobacteria bacterium]|jgi:hypothetical protein|nr:hypothetical protein [Fibrobacteria bacterium]